MTSNTSYSTKKFSMLNGLYSTDFPEPRFDGQLFYKVSFLKHLLSNEDVPFISEVYCWYDESKKWVLLREIRMCERSGQENWVPFDEKS